METPSLSEVIECSALKNFMIEEEKTSFFLGREILVCTNKPGMARWHKSLYSAMSRVAQRPAEFFKPGQPNRRIGTTCGILKLLQTQILHRFLLACLFYEITAAVSRNFLR